MMQAELFDETVQLRHRPSLLPTRADVRAHAGRIIAYFRDLPAMPAADAPYADRNRAGCNQAILPQMVGWLPEDEARDLCRQLDDELRRLGVEADATSRYLGPTEIEIS